MADRWEHRRTLSWEEAGRLGELGWELVGGVPAGAGAGAWQGPFESVLYLLRRRAGSGPPEPPGGGGAAP